MKAHEALGLVLASFGATLLVLLFLVYPSVPLLALAVSVMLPGLVLLSLSFSPSPRRASALMLETAAMQVEALLEEFKPTERAVYVYREEGFVTALVPLRAPLGLDSLINAARSSPFKTLLVSGSGSCLELLPPGARVPELAALEGADLESAVAAVLEDTLELAEDTRVILSGGRVIMSFRPLVSVDLPRFKECLGSLPTSVAACVVAAATGRPVRLLSEEEEEKSLRVVLELLG